MTESDEDTPRARFVLGEASRRVASFGSLVRTRRLEEGMSVVRLSEVTGIGRRFIHELEAGKDTVQLGRALLVAEAVGIDLVTALRSHLADLRDVPGAEPLDDELPEPDEPEDDAPGFGR